MRPVVLALELPSPSFRRTASSIATSLLSVEVRHVALRLGHALRGRAAHLRGSSTRRLGPAATATRRRRDRARTRRRFRCGRRFAARAAACSTSRSTIRPPGPVPANAVELDAALARDPARERRRAARRDPGSASVGSGFASGAGFGAPASRAAAPAVPACASGCAARAPSPQASRRASGAGAAAGFGAPCCASSSAARRFRGRRARRTAPRSRRRRAPTRPPASGPRQRALVECLELHVRPCRSRPRRGRRRWRRGRPRCFSQRRILPSSMVSESFGMVTSIGMAVSAPPRRPDRPGAAAPAERRRTAAAIAIRRRQHERPRGCSRTAWARRGWSRARAARRAQSNASRDDERDHLGRDAGERPALLHHDAAMRLAHGLEDRLLVERADRAQVERPRASMPSCASASAAFSATCTILPHVTHRDVATRPLHVRDPERHDVLARRAPRPSARTSISLSMKQTGLSSRIAALSRPFAVRGRRRARRPSGRGRARRATRAPASAARRARAPRRPGRGTTIGSVNCPFDM